MKKLKFGLFVAILSVTLFACKNSKNTTGAEVEEREGGVQIDPELKELGELNAKLLEYDDIGIPQNGVVPIKLKEKWGLVAKDGKEILPCLYNEISYGDNEDVWIVKKDDSLGIVDNKGTFINELRSGFISYRCLGNGLLHAIFNDEVQHPFIIPLEYKGQALLGDVKSATPFYDGVTMAEYFGNYKLYSYTNGSLSAITDYYQHFTLEFGEGMYCVTNGWDGKYGFINSKGEVAVPFEFDKPCGVFSDGMATYTSSTDKYGYIDKTGKIVIPAKYFYAEKFSDGLAYVSNEEMSGFIDKSGKTVIDTSKKKYSSGGGFVKGYCIVIDGEEDCMMGIINKKGELVVPFKYNVISALSDDVYVALKSENSKYGAFSSDGKQIIPFEFDDLSEFHNGWALAKIGEVHLIVNKEGKTGIPNLENVLSIKKEKQLQSIKSRQAELEMSIKKQVVELINKSNGWEVLSEPSDVLNLEKVSDNMYKAEFITETKYEYMDYEIRNIEVDKKGKVLGLETKRVNIRPKANKPNGTMRVDEMIDRMTGRKRY